MTHIEHTSSFPASTGSVNASSVLDTIQGRKSLRRSMEIGLFNIEPQGPIGKPGGQMYGGDSDSCTMHRRPEMSYVPDAQLGVRSAGILASSKLDTISRCGVSR